MIKLIAGFILGVIVSTVGISGIGAMADNGVASAKTAIKQVSTAPNDGPIITGTVAKLSPELQAAIAKELSAIQPKN